MKYFFFLLFFSNVLLFSQNDWLWQNPLPQGNTLYSVSFADSLIGWAVGEHGTILKSTDGGETWGLQQSTITERLHSVHTFNENNVFAIGENGTILKTDDGGENWNSKKGDQSGINRSFFVDAQIGWMIGNGGIILKTTDAGDNWNPQSSRTNADLFGVTFVSPDSGWVVGADTTILITTDGGINWNRESDVLAKQSNSILKEKKGFLKTSLAAQGESYNDVAVEVGHKLHVIVASNGNVRVIDTQQFEHRTHNLGGFHLTKIQIVDANTILIFGLNGCFYKSTDRGVTFSPRAISADDFRISSLLPPSEDFAFPGLLIGGENGAMFKSTDIGQTWSAKSSSLVSTNTNLTCMTNVGSKLWVAGHSGKVLLTTDGGDNWTVQTTGTTQTFNSISFVDENTGWVTSNFLGQGNIRKTTNEGDSWFLQTSGISTTINHINFIDINTGWLVGGGGTILKTTDGGGIWNPQSSGTNSAIISTSIVNENIVWAAGSNGIILKTTDGGTNWNTQPSGTTNNLRSIASINENTAYAVGIFNTILKTTNGGETWTTQTSEALTYLRSVSFVDENTGWAAGFGGILLKTTNGGTEWLQLNSGTNKNIEAVVAGRLPFLRNGLGGTNKNIETVVFNDTNTVWIVGESASILKTTTGGGVTSIDEKSSDLLPDDFLLYQNYPNPFNPVTVIGYRIPVISNVSLKVYDALGREIAILVNEEKPAGRYEVVFDGSGLSSGVYFYRISVTPHSGQAGNFSEVKKLLLLK